MTCRWLIAAAAILTLGAISLFNAPAMAREEHPRYGHVPARELTAIRSDLAVFIQEHLFDVLSKSSGDLKGQVEARFVLACLNCVDALAGDAYRIGEVSLRPFFLSSQNTKARLHSSYL